MSKRAGMRSEARMSQNEGQGVTVQGISTSDGTTISTQDAAFKTPEELMSIPVGTGRIWTPGRGNTSIPFYAPNYWKLKKVRGLIDDNPLYNGPKASSASRWFKYSPLRRHWRIVAVAAAVLAGGIYLHNVTGNAEAWPRPPMINQPPAPPHIASPAPPKAPAPQHHRR
jgi:hypothetical protein